MHPSSPPSSSSRARDGGDSSTDDKATVEAGGCFVRLMWIAGGPVALLAYIGYLFEEKPPLVSVESLGFWPVVGLLLLMRHVDVTRYGGETLNRTPSTSSGQKRYALWLVVLSAAAWLAALLT